MAFESLAKFEHEAKGLRKPADNYGNEQTVDMDDLKQK